jgi:CheY-like chemotaxis protein
MNSWIINPSVDGGRALAFTILIVEDHTSTREGLAKLLEYAGYSVLSAEDGQQGFMVACEQPPDLILTDMMMPIIDGTEMIRRLRATTECKDIPVVVLTAFGDKALEAARAGANEVIGKPIDPQTLLRTIQTLL